jgi:hypothetical protein
MKRLKIQWLKWAKYFRGFTIFPTENPSLKKKNHLIIDEGLISGEPSIGLLCGKAQIMP